MPVPSSITDISTTAASNSPAGSDPIGGTLDDYLRSIQAILKKQFVKGSNLASANTLPVPAEGSYFTVTGTTTITAFANCFDGRTVTLYFPAGITLTHSSALTLPGGASIVTQAGDVGTFVNDGTSIWRCTSYTPAAVGIFPGRNRLINGNFDVWQRGTTFSISQNTYTYYADRWRISYNTGTVTASRLTHTAANAAYGTYYTRVSLVAANTAPIDQPIENVRTLSGQTVTFSFYANIASGSAQTVAVAATQYFGTGGSPSANVRTSATVTVANTGFARYTATLTLPSLNGKIIGSNGNDYLLMAIELPGGTYSVDVFGLQLEAGNAATPFEFRPFAQELAMCQRYYEKSYSQSDAPGTVTNIGGVLFPIITAIPNGYQVGPSVNYVVTKRAAPTITIYSYNGAINKFTYSGGTDASTNSCQPNLIGDYCFFCVNNSGASTALTAGAQFHFTANAEL